MTSFRERVNAHLPIVLQLLSSLSLVVIALTAICGSNSLRKLAESHGLGSSENSKMHHLDKGHEH